MIIQLHSADGSVPGATLQGEFMLNTDQVVFMVPYRDEIAKIDRTQIVLQGSPGATIVVEESYLKIRDIVSWMVPS